VRAGLAAALALMAGAGAEDEQLSAPWKTIAPGVEVASAADLGADPGWAARVLLIDPAKARFAVRFDPETPTLAQWRERYPQALAISVGSFYSLDREVRPTCDLVSDGRLQKGAGCKVGEALWFGAQPKPHPARPALRARLKAEVLPGAPRLMSVAEFHPEHWQEALKSFPALVHGGFPSCVGHRYCSDVSRTAALAQLRDGRILLFASQWPAVRRDVARFLAEELGAEEAVNLDGGPEAALAIRGEAFEQTVGSPKVPLPFVLVVLPP
jgi:hypothetical protein